MAQDEITFLQGEAKLLTMYLCAASGVVTASSGTFTLWDVVSGVPTIVSGFNAVSATCDPPAAIVKVQYLMNSTGLSAGKYYAMLKASALTSADNISQTREFDYDVYITRCPDLP